MQVRRRRRRRSALRGATGAGCLDLRLDTHGGGDGGGDISYLCSTPSSCDGVECVFAFPTGARAIGRVGARRFDAAGVSNAAPTGTGAFCKAMWDGIRAEPGEATMARLSRRAAPRHLGSTRRAPASSPPRLVRVRYPQRLPWSLAPIVPARLRRAPQACARRRPARLRGRRP